MSEQLLDDWNARLECAESMLPLIGRLYRNNGILPKMFGQPLINSSPVDIIKTHKMARRVTGDGVFLEHTHQVLSGLVELSPPGVLRLDIGKLAVKFRESGGDDMVAFLREELAKVETDRLPVPERPRDIVLFGFGRIGRLVARMLIDKASTKQGLRLAATSLPTPNR